MHEYSRSKYAERKKTDFILVVYKINLINDAYVKIILKHSYACSSIMGPYRSNIPSNWRVQFEILSNQLFFMWVLTYCFFRQNFKWNSPVEAFNLKDPLLTEIEQKYTVSQTNRNRLSRRRNFKTDCFHHRVILL